MLKAKRRLSAGSAGTGVETGGVRSESQARPNGVRRTVTKARVAGLRQEGPRLDRARCAIADHGCCKRHVKLPPARRAWFRGKVRRRCCVFEVLSLWVSWKPKSFWREVLASSLLAL